jgi:hypothetical protein
VQRREEFSGQGDAHADLQTEKQIHPASADRSRQVGGSIQPLDYDKELQRGNPNRATLAVARKLVAYLLAVDRRKQNFVPAEEFRTTAAAQKTFPRKEKTSG